VPHLLSPVFTGQNEICRCLDLSLALERHAQPQVQRRFVLYGLGGSGKTQICVRFAQVYRERYIFHHPMQVV
jgi:signal recognition particle GTPase